MYNTIYIYDITKTCRLCYQSMDSNIWNYPFTQPLAINTGQEFDRQGYNNTTTGIGNPTYNNENLPSQQHQQQIPLHKKKYYYNGNQNQTTIPMSIISQNWSNNNNDNPDLNYKCNITSPHHDHSQSYLTTTLETLEQTMKQNNSNILNNNISLAPTMLIKRVVLFSCPDLDMLCSLLSGFSNFNDISCYKQLWISDQHMVAVGWFDYRKVQIQIQQLNLLVTSATNGSQVYFRFINDENWLNAVVQEHGFKFLEDGFATIYICLNLLSGAPGTITKDVFEKDCYLYLSKFGAIESFENLQGFHGIYKCVYFDVRSPFEARKVSTVNLTGLMFSIHSTVIELYENLSTQNWGVDANRLLNSLEPTDGEWRKYQFLKHRRLATLPFGLTFIPRENRINIMNIENGSEKRKTLMIRNIPNKIKHEDLEEFIDLTSKGAYDFLYLRIDFENHCNVGYAFISFIDSKDIIKFFRYRAGKKWNKLNSEKVCELAYAKIQGKEKLINKFKHSKVMDQSPEYHPRIYHSDGPLKGQPEVFPVPDSPFGMPLFY